MKITYFVIHEMPKELHLAKQIRVPLDGVGDLYKGMRRQFVVYAGIS